MILFNAIHKSPPKKNSKYNYVKELLEISIQYVL